MPRSARNTKTHTTSAIIFEACRFATAGCKQYFRTGSEELYEHQVVCDFKLVHCPGYHSGTCHHLSPRRNILNHIFQPAPATGDLCVEVCYRKTEYEPFVFLVQEAPDSGGLLFSTEEGFTYIKPVMLINPKIKEYLVYCSIVRHPTGLWFIYLRSLQHMHLLRNIWCNLTVHHVDGTFMGPCHSHHTYNGAVVPQTLSHKEVCRSGKCMIISDAHILPLSSENRLFKIRVEVRSPLTTGLQIRGMTSDPLAEEDLFTLMDQLHLEKLKNQITEPLKPIIPFFPLSGGTST